MARGAVLLVFLIIVPACSESTAGRNADVEARLHDLETLVLSQQAKAETLRAQLQQQQQKIDRQESQLLAQELQLASLAKERQLAGNVEEIETALDHMWLLFCGSLVMFMQAGFAMVEAGCCRSNNVQSMLLKNLTDVCVGTISWWIFGYAFALGGPDNEGTVNADGTQSGDGFLDGGFIGRTQFFGTGFLEADSNGVFTVTKTSANWFFQWAFCSVAATIVSGGVAERVRFPAYVCYSLIMTGFIYPVVVAWTWGYGFLAMVTETGYMDFAGSGIVHMTGGVGALVGTTIAGPRAGRWERPQDFVPHNMPLVVLGTFLLWFGWYGFNCGSTISLHTAEQAHLAAHVAMNTTIAATAAGLTVFVLSIVTTRKYCLAKMCNGILAGLVSIAGPCANIESASAFAVGVIAALVYSGASALLTFAKVDDPIDAFAVHGACGAWGVLAAALFDWGKGFNYAHGWNGFNCVADDNGMCSEGAWVGLFGANILEIVVIVSWVAGLSVLIFLPMSFAGVLCVNEQLHADGLDPVRHCPPKAYTFGSSAPTCMLFHHK